MPDSLNGLSNDQLKILLGAMEEKIDMTRTNQGFGVNSITESPLNNLNTKETQLINQLEELIKSLKTDKTGDNKHQNQETQINSVENEKNINQNIDIDLRSFDYMQDNKKKETVQEHIIANNLPNIATTQEQIMYINQNNLNQNRQEKQAQDNTNDYSQPSQSNILNLNTDPSMDNQISTGHATVNTSNNLITIIENLLEESGFAQEIMNLLETNASDHMIQNKVNQFLTVAKMIPDIKAYGDPAIYQHVYGVIEEMKIVVEFNLEKSKQQHQEPQLNQELTKTMQYENSSYNVAEHSNFARPLNQVTTSPQINLKPETKTQTKVVDVKDIFKKITGRGNNDEKVESQELKEPRTVFNRQVQYRDTSQSNQTQHQYKQNVSFSQNNYMNVNEDYQKPAPIRTDTNGEIQLKKFELLKEMLITYIEGAAARELIRGRDEILANKYFLLELYEQTMNNNDLSLQNEILEKILNTINKRLGLVKSANGTIATWVELDELISNLRNIYLNEERIRNS